MSKAKISLLLADTSSDPASRLLVLFQLLDLYRDLYDASLAKDDHEAAAFALRGMQQVATLIDAMSAHQDETATL